MFDKFKGKIIWSADGISLKKLLAIIEGNFAREDVAVKLDGLFLMKNGLSAIDKVQKLGVPVFADAKIVEIPSKVNEIVKIYLKHRPWMLNVMAGACSNGILQSDNPKKLDELYQFASLCKDAGTKSCVVTVLTTKSNDFANQEFGKSIIDAVVFYAKFAINCGITDIVCSPSEAKSVRALGSIDINTPGVRLPESGMDDQDKDRVKTPAKALADGADRLVMGRDLSRDGKFNENLAKIMANIEGGQV